MEQANVKQNEKRPGAKLRGSGQAWKPVTLSRVASASLLRKHWLTQSFLIAGTCLSLGQPGGRAGGQPRLFPSQTWQGKAVWRPGLQSDERSPAWDTETRGVTAVAGQHREDRESSWGGISPL